MCIIVTIKPNKIMVYAQYAVWNFIMYVVKCGSCKQSFGQAENNDAIVLCYVPVKGSGRYSFHASHRKAK